MVSNCDFSGASGFSDRHKYLQWLHVIRCIKVEYHANANPLKNSGKIAYVGQRLMYPIIKKNNTLPH